MANQKIGRIVVKPSANKQKFIVLQAANNRTLAHTETFKTNQGVKTAIAALKKVVPKAKVVDLTKKSSS